MVYTGVGAVAGASLGYVGHVFSSDNKSKGSDKDSDYDESGRGKKR
jgi:hypothetical protein